MQLTPAEALLALSTEPRRNIESVYKLSRAVASGLPQKPSKIHTIAVIGLRGVGKSTLALMASADLGYTYVDVEKCVSEYTGKPEAVYLKEVSVEEYQELQYRLITTKILAHKEKSSVVVMPSTTINSAKLMQFLKSGHFSLIINVECEEERILKYTNFPGTPAQGIDLVRKKLDIYRDVATHDFFNCFSDGSSGPLVSVGGPQSQIQSSFFVLKPVQRDFSRFLFFLIRGADAAWAYTGNLHLRSGLDDKFSNCLSIQVPLKYDVAEIDFVGVDYVELNVTMLTFIRENIQAPSLQLCGIVSKLRRLTRSSIPIIMSVSGTSEELTCFVQDFAPSSSPEEITAVKSALQTYYLSLLGSAIRLGCDYLSLNLNLFDNDHSNFLFNSSGSSEEFQKCVYGFFSSLIVNRGSTQIIGTYASEDPYFWKANAHKIVELAHHLQLSVVRISSIAAKISQNYLIVEFMARTAKEPREFQVCAYNRGPLGVLSRMLNQYMTPITVSPGDSFTAFSLQEAHSSAGLVPKLKFYVLGSNVQASASPLLHGEAFEKMGLPYEFELHECTELESHFTNLTTQPDFGGAAVLMPFKSSALALVDELSNHVKVIGALNTIIPKRSSDQPDKVLGIRGENTDWLGVKIALTNNTSPINSANDHKVALVLGAGGMARSAIYALIQLGYKKILLYNRTRSRAEQLADYYNRLSPLLPSKSLTTSEMCDSQKDLMYFEVVVLSEGDLTTGAAGSSPNMYPVCIVSCIPSVERGLEKPIEVPIHETWFGSSTGGTVLQTSYVPLHSSTLERAEQFRRQGWTVVNGFTWLLAQSIAQFEMFTGKQAPVALMQRTAESVYEEAIIREASV